MEIGLAQGLEQQISPGMRLGLLGGGCSGLSYTFAWDYPFTVKHQNTSVVLLTGKGVGPFSGPAGAASVATELVKALKPYRLPTR